MGAAMMWGAGPFLGCTAGVIVGDLERCVLVATQPPINQKPVATSDNIVPDAGEKVDRAHRGPLWDKKRLQL